MVTSPPKDSPYPESDILVTLSGSEPHSSSPMLSLDSWQSISDERAYNEYSILPPSGAANAAMVPSSGQPPAEDLTSDYIAASAPMPAAFDTFTLSGVLRPTDDLEMRKASLQDVDTIGQLPWIGSDTWTSGQKVLPTSQNFPFMDHARNSPEVMFISDQVVVPQRIFGTSPALTTNNGTLTSMPEVLSGLLIDNVDDFVTKQNGARGSLTKIWTCDIDGCTKHFNEQHKYNKHVRSHSREYTCRYQTCLFSCYQKKDVKRHISTVHRKVKIPCPLEDCQYSQYGPRRGISRKDALRRHLLSHGMTPDMIETLQDMGTSTDRQDLDVTLVQHHSPQDTESLNDFICYP